MEPLIMMMAVVGPGGLWAASKGVYDGGHYIWVLRGPGGLPDTRGAFLKDSFALSGHDILVRADPAGRLFGYP